MCSYLTFASGGYIIKIKPIANGIFVVPLENELMNPEEDGMAGRNLMLTFIIIFYEVVIMVWSLL